METAPSLADLIRGFIVKAEPLLKLGPIKNAHVSGPLGSPDESEKLRNHKTEWRWSANTVSNYLAKRLTEAGEGDLSVSVRKFRAQIVSLVHGEWDARAADAWRGDPWFDLRAALEELVERDESQEPYQIGVPFGLGDLDRLLKACGVRSMAEPEPRPARGALRNVLRVLFLDRGDETTVTLRSRARYAAATPHGFRRHDEGSRMPRYHLAAGLSERPFFRPDREYVEDGVRCSERAWRDDDWESANLGEPDLENPPQLPPRVTGCALAALGLVDLEVVGEDAEACRGSFTATNVLREVLTESRWPADVRAVMVAVLDATPAQVPTLASQIKGLADLGSDPTPLPSALETTTKAAPKEPTADTKKPGRPRTTNSQSEQVARVLRDNVTRDLSHEDLKAKLPKIKNMSAAVSAARGNYPANIIRNEDADGWVTFTWKA